MCECIKDINEQLISRNLKVKIPIASRQGQLVALTPEIVTEKIDNSKKAGSAVLMAAYCPWCGEKYPDGE